MKTPRIYVQLGRLGDILNILPLCKRYQDTTGETPYLMVAAEFAGILDGVSYVKRIIWPGPWDVPFPAVFQARKLTSDVVLCQIHGAGIVTRHQCDSFARESWHAAQADVPWGSLPLVIDRRDRDREAKLLRSLSIGPENEYGTTIVLFAGQGNSSPFPFAKDVLANLKGWEGSDGRVIDLSEVRAERFHDLLGLFERASCLVTIDTAHLHLAAAVPRLPVVAFVTRDPDTWHGTPWRPNEAARYYYDEAPSIIQQLKFDVCFPDSRRPQIIHAWCDWRDVPPGPEAARRAKTAQASWKSEYATGRWIAAELTQADSKRTGKDIGDPHPVPYIHDIMDHGAAHAKSEDDIICFSNADVGFTPGLTGRILTVMRRHEAVWTHRRDFKRIDAPFVSEAEVKHGDWYPGTDLIACTVRWWNAHKRELGDYLAGREYWDEAFRQLIKYHGGAYIEHACWHEWHGSFWCGEKRWELAGNVHNFRLRAEWFGRTGFVPEDFRYFRVVEGGDCHPKPYPNDPARAP
ncbi:MAG: hypothetical protein JSR30_00135 [Proteobacteria bacterium]|nr:hypothetical protein [Pseudomonadota bacterium]